MARIKEGIIHSLWRTLSVVSVLLVIGGISWAIYVMAIKPHTNPTRTHEQIAEHITNVTEVKEEEAIVLSLFPPRVKFGGIDVRIFGKPAK